jgi:hypothetical protein
MIVGGPVRFNLARTGECLRLSGEDSACHVHSLRSCTRRAAHAPPSTIRCPPRRNCAPPISPELAGSAQLRSDSPRGMGPPRGEQFAGPNRSPGRRSGRRCRGAQRSDGAAFWGPRTAPLPRGAGCAADARASARPAARFATRRVPGGAPRPPPRRVAVSANPVKWGHQRQRCGAAAARAAVGANAALRELRCAVRARPRCLRVVRVRADRSCAARAARKQREDQRGEQGQRRTASARKPSQHAPLAARRRGGRGGRRGRGRGRRAEQERERARGRGSTAARPGSLSRPRTRAAAQRRSFLHPRGASILQEAQRGAPRRQVARRWFADGDIATKLLSDASVAALRAPPAQRGAAALEAVFRELQLMSFLETLPDQSAPPPSY